MNTNIDYHIEKAKSALDNAIPYHHNDGGDSYLLESIALSNIAIAESLIRLNEKLDLIDDAFFIGL